MLISGAKALIGSNPSASAFAESSNGRTVPSEGINGGSIPSSATGKLAEWFKAAVLKTVVLKGTVGSNPSLSAADSI